MDVSYIPSLMDFPDDVLIIIFDQLDVEDLKSITLINSRCLQLATTTQSINKKFKLTIKEDSNAVIFEALMESNRYFKSVCIKHTRDEYGRDCSLNPIINLMKRIGAYTKNMEFKCEFHNWHRKPLIDLLELLPNVVTLNLICGRYHFEESLASPIQLKFNQLKEAKLPFNMLCDTLKQVNTLEKLEALDSSFHATNSERNLEFVHILRNNQSTLKSLKFNYNHIRQLDIQAFCNLNLSELEYDSDYDNINNEEKNIFSNFLNSQHQMKRLTLLMVDADFWNPIMKMTNLEYLDLNIAYESSNELLIHNLDCHQKNKSLKFLRIQFELGDNDLKLCQSFVDFFPGLITFELSLDNFEMDEETPKSFFLSFNNHPALQKVKLTAFGSSTAKLGALKINQLEEVDITNVDFTVNDWKVFTTNNPNIKSLIIFHTPLNTEGLEQIVNNLIHLEEIEITYEEDFQFQYADLKLILEKCKHMKRIYGVLKEEPEHYLEIFKEFAEKLKTIKCWFQNAGNSDINIVNLL